MSEVIDTGAPALRLGWWLSSEEHDPRALVAHVTAAEAAGFKTAMISDHLQPWVRAQGNAPHVWTTIGAIANATSEMEIGTGVSAMVERNSPIAVAHAAATAAVLLEGRFFLGVGTGERLNEQAFGTRWPAHEERRERLREAVDVVRALWKGDLVNHRGEHWRVQQLRLYTLPAEPPPIYIAASGKKSAQMAGECGDGMIGVAPQAELVDVFRGADGPRRPCVAQLHVSLGATLDSARENVWKWWPHSAVPPSLLTELATPAQFEAAANAIGTGEMPADIVCAVDAASIIAAIDRFVGAGFNVVYLHQIGPDQRRLADLSTSELLPHYATGPA